MANPQKGTVGLVITVTVKDQTGAAVNLAGATVKNILFEKPSGVVLTKIGDYVNDGADGKLKYTTIAGDLDLSGLWTVQPDVAVVGFSGKGSKNPMIVEGNVGE